MEPSGEGRRVRVRRVRVRRVRWRRVGVTVGILAMVVLAGGAIAEQFFALRAREALIGLADTSLYPDRMVVCRGATSPACAAEASRRVGRPVAWLPQSAAVRVRVMVAARTPTTVWADQDSKVDGTILVSLGSAQGQPRGQVVQTVREHGDTLLAYEANVDGRSKDVELRWEHAGAGFALGGVQLDPWAPPLGRGRLIALWRQVRYAAPPPR